ncbi:MAG: hypothetical protein ACRDRX_05155 [Pseudonocardiaceae bacterium]
MTAPPLNLEVTRARRLFKELAGQNNHFLITILVGLDAVNRGAVRVPPELSTSWNPHDPQRSVRRSREFAISALLAWLVDALQAYVHALITVPIVVSDSALRNKLESGSLGERVIALANATGQYTAERYLVELAIIWRNRVVHFEARNRVGSHLASCLQKCSQDIEGLYQGLVINQTLDSVGRSRKPTFKEITALVRAVHKFVEAVDQAVLTTVDLNAYLADALGIYLSEDPVMRSAKVWGKEFERRVSAIVQIAQNYGMTVARINRSNTLTPAKIDSLAKLSPRQARQKFANASVKILI